MFPQEARWLSEQLQDARPRELSPLLNLGSSDLHFRTQVQPYIDRILFAPLAQRGFEVVHCDLRASAGVDIVADILDDGDYARLRAVQPRAIICTNLHEHVRDPAALAHRCLDLLPSGGLLFVTVPHRYPYHRDPIDTRYRPNPVELAALHPGTQVLTQTLLDLGTYRDQLAGRWTRVFGDLWRDLQTLRETRSANLLRLRWWNQPYQQSCVVLRKI